jgi:hypothetical protein
VEGPFARSLVYRSLVRSVPVRIVREAILAVVTFRDRLIETLRAVEPLLEVSGVLVGGSEVPNLLEAGAAATLVVSEDVDLVVPVAAHSEVKSRLDRISRLVPSADEPSVWIPREDEAQLIEVNFIGMDPAIVDPIDTYEKVDDLLPLMVFGPLSLLAPGRMLNVDDLRVPVPRVAGLALEKLVTDRTGEKGDRDLLVVAGLLVSMSPEDLAEVESTYITLPPEMRHQVRSNLAILSLLDARPGMPDPRPQRAAVDALLRRLEAI